MAQTVSVTQLKPQTAQAFEEYVREAEAGMEGTLGGRGPFLWSQADRARAQKVRKGDIVAERWSGKEPVKVPDGLVHDWIGAAFAAAATVTATLALLQDYDHHKDVYKPEVVESRLISRRGNDFKIYLRLLKKKIITVVLDTDHDAHYATLDATRWSLRSYTTRIAEVEDAGKPGEKILAPDAGYGFLWRLYSYWRFEERDGGVYIECRAISLSRDIPKGLGWIIEPIVGKLPKESLINTLKATRQGLAAAVPPA
jgi:hypothetical protein